MIHHLARGCAIVLALIATLATIFRYSYWLHLANDATVQVIAPGVVSSAFQVALTFTVGTACLWGVVYYLGLYLRRDDGSQDS